MRSLFVAPRSPRLAIMLFVSSLGLMACDNGGATVDGGPRGDAGPIVMGMNGDHPPNDGTCRFARATRYPIYREGGVPFGTCSFGPVAAAMPRVFRDGYVIAPNEAFYAAGNEAGGCGECFEITGPLGSMVVMAADICDIACCDNCRGDTVAFDLEEAHWMELVNQTGGNVPVGWRSVPCPTEGPIRAYFTSGYQAGDRFRLVVYNHRIGVRSVEVRGPLSGATHGEWTALERTMDNYFDWTGRGDSGMPISLRVTSTQGEVIEFAELAALTSDLRIEATEQFTDRSMGAGATCGWPGPEPVVYGDALGGLMGLAWRDWGSYMLLDRSEPDYAWTEGCEAGSACIAVGRLDAWGAIQIGNPNQFPPSTFTAVELWARTDGPAYDGFRFYYNGDDAEGAAAASEMVDLGTVDGTWRHFRFELAPIVSAVAWMQVIRVTNQRGTATPALFLDEIRFLHD